MMRLADSFLVLIDGARAAGADACFPVGGRETSGFRAGENSAPLWQLADDPALDEMQASFDSGSYLRRSNLGQDAPGRPMAGEGWEYRPTLLSDEEREGLPAALLHGQSACDRFDTGMNRQWPQRACRYGDDNPASFIATDGTTGADILFVAGAPCPQFSFGEGRCATEADLHRTKDSH